jgi:hypothetical protein
VTPGFRVDAASLRRPLLGPDELLGYLIEHGVLSPVALDDPTLRLSEVPGRNLNARVTGGGRSLFVKQLRDHDLADGVTREVAWATAASCAPPLVAADPEHGIVVTELFQGSSLGDLVRRSNVATPSEHLRDAADALAALPGPDDPDAAAPRHRGLEWSAMLRSSPGSALRELSPATLEALLLVRGDRRLLAAVGEVAETTGERFCHGDARFDNVFLRDDGTVGLVDGEASGRGPESWDLACLLGDALAHWLRSVPPAASGSFDPSTARIPFPDVQEGLRSAVAATAARRGQDVDPVTLAALIGLRLVQTTLEQTRGHTTMPPSSYALLQFAANVLHTPDRAARVLSG